MQGQATIDILLFLGAMTAAFTAAWIGRSRPPAMDSERLFKVILATLLRGEDPPPDPEAWRKKVEERLWFHPAWRQGWARLQNPESFVVPVPAAPGELALMEALPGRAAGEERFDLMFRGEHQTWLLEDPRQLGRDYEPSGWLGPDLDWEGLAEFSEGVRACIGRRLDGLRVVLVAGTDDARASAWLAAFESLLPTDLLGVEAPGWSPGGIVARARELAESLDRPETRLALVGLGDAGFAALEVLAESPAFRERCAFVTLVGVPVGGVPEPSPPGLDEASTRAWVRENFRQERLDVELRRNIPYVFLPLLRTGALPPGDGRVPWESQRLSEPLVPPSGRRPIQVVELGPLPAHDEALPAPLAARALALLWISLLPS